MHFSHSPGSHTPSILGLQFYAYTCFKLHPQSDISVCSVLAGDKEVRQGFSSIDLCGRSSHGQDLYRRVLSKQKSPVVSDLLKGKDMVGSIVKVLAALVYSDSG